MQTLLLILALGLTPALRAQAAPASEEAVSERWYLRAVVTDRGASEETVEGVSPLTITALGGGDLEVKTTMLWDGQCQEVKVVLESTNDPGKFTAFGGKYHVSIQPLHVEGYYTLYGEGQLNGHPFRMAQLVGKGLDHNEEALAEFREFTGGRGFDTEKVIVPEQKEACTTGEE